MKVPPKYIAFDVESGGIETDKSLLTVYFAVLDEYWDLVDELDLKCRPDDGVYRVTADALKVNGIDLLGHDMHAMTCKDAASEIYEFLNRVTNKGSIKLIPVGHNVHFDVDFVVAHTLSKKTWDKFVGYRKLDTGTISLFLMDVGLLPQMNASLGTLAKYFNITFDAHTAKGDTLCTVEVMKNLIKTAHAHTYKFATPE